MAVPNKRINTDAAARRWLSATRWAASTQKREINTEMVPERTFRSYLYSTKLLIITLVGFVLLGTAILLALQRIWSIPSWIQYLALTAMIAAAFVSSCYLAARPARLQINDRGVTIEQNKKDAKTVLWEDIKRYAYYDELMLHSLKVSLRSDETVSIIDFKWNDGAGFQSFLQQFESGLNASRDRGATDTVEKAETFYGSRKKGAITVALLVAYVCLVAILWTRDAFGSCNPVVMYYFWVLPVAFFTKMLKAR
jgi:uncharacterized membrane protein